MAEAMDFAYVLIVDEGRQYGRTRAETEALLRNDWQPVEVPVDDEAAVQEFMGMSMESLLAQVEAD